MAKTLIYAAGSPTSVKIGDTDTDLYLQVAKDNVAVDLTAVKSITVKIADTNKNYLKDISISPSNLTDGNQGILIVPLNSGNISGLNSGDYYFEVWIVTADGDSEIYPDMNVTKFHVFNNIVGGTTVLTTLAMQAFLDKITNTQNNSEIVLQAAQAELQNANTALSNANTALNDLNSGNYLTKDTLSSAPSFSALQTQVNNSAVGTNLLIGTHSNWQSRDIVVATDWATEDVFNLTNNDLDANTDYTFSSEIKSDNNSYSWHTEIGAWDSDGNYTRLGNANQVNNGKSITAFNTGNYVKFEFRPHVASNNPQATTVYWRHEKLGKGTLATDWCPNPTEILTQSDYAKIKAAIVALGGSLS